MFHSILFNVDKIKGHIVNTSIWNINLTICNCCRPVHHVNLTR